MPLTHLRAVQLVSILALGLALALGVALSSTRAVALDEVPAEELRPDLQTLKPKDIELVSARVKGKLEWRLRFDNEILNAGSGPLELYPVQSSSCQGRVAYQRLFTDSFDTDAFERGTDSVGREVPVGCMAFHPQHHHWHLENFARYDLNLLSTGATVASSSKVSFCVIDIHRTLPGLTGSPANPYYTSCSRTSTNGLSVGWSDEYNSALADQYIVLPPNLASGDYCLVSTADEVNQIIESDDTNNATGVKVHIDMGTHSATPRNPTDLCSP